MADRYNHPDGVKSLEVSLEGKMLKKRKQGRMGHEASRLAEKGSIDYDKSGILEKRTKKLESVAGKMGRKPQAAASGYLKDKEDVYKEIDKAFE